jgi:transcription initiation factor TFIID subunit TAF12
MNIDEFYVMDVSNATLSVQTSSNYKGEQQQQKQQQQQQQQQIYTYSFHEYSALAMTKL